MTGEPIDGVTLSIIIVNWNTRDLLAACLESVAAEIARMGEGEAETFVVDNASTDGSPEMVQEDFPWVRLIRNTENVGFARANNQAIRLAQGRYLLLLNSDTCLHAGSLQTLVDFMDAHPAAGAAGPRLLNGDGTLQVSCHPLLTPEREFWRLSFLERLYARATYPLEAWDATTPHRVEVIKGACLLGRRMVLDQTGLLDESYFMYTEEMDLCYRMAQAGWELWHVPAATVTHYGEASSRQVAADMYVQLYRSKVQFHRKFGGASRARRFKALMALAYLPRACAASGAALLSPGWRSRARIYRRLLAALPGM